MYRTHYNELWLTCCPCKIEGLCQEHLQKVQSEGGIYCWRINVHLIARFIVIQFEFDDIKRNIMSYLARTQPQTSPAESQYVIHSWLGAMRWLYIWKCVEAVETPSACCWRRLWKTKDLAMLLCGDQTIIRHMFRLLHLLCMKIDDMFKTDKRHGENPEIVIPHQDGGVC
jgi:hypothetical protein